MHVRAVELHRFAHMFQIVAAYRDSSRHFGVFIYASLLVMHVQNLRAITQAAKLRSAPALMVLFLQRWWSQQLLLHCSQAGSLG